MSYVYCGCENCKEYSGKDVCPICGYTEKYCSVDKEHLAVSSFGNIRTHKFNKRFNPKKPIKDRYNKSRCGHGSNSSFSTKEEAKSKVKELNIKRDDFIEKFGRFRNPYRKISRIYLCNICGKWHFSFKQK